MAVFFDSKLYGSGLGSVEVFSLRTQSELTDWLP